MPNNLSAPKISERYREVVGHACSCGGRLLIQDSRPVKGVNREWSYEVFCEKCYDCDPNGYSSVRKCLDAVPEFWKEPPRNLK